MSDNVIIIGGGIAGLATAYELHRRGVACQIIEQSPRAGGVILSEEIDGFTIDAGPDALLIQKADGIKLCEELGLGDRLVSTLPPRLAYIQRAGKLHPLPAHSVLGIPTEIGPFLRTRLFSWPGKLRMGAELFVPPRRDGLDESIGAFIARRFGKEATDYLAEPLLAGIHAGDVDRLSLRSLFPRFADAEQKHGSLLRAFRRQQRSASGGAPGAVREGAFKSLLGGLSELVRALERALPRESLQLETAVRCVSHPGPDGHYRVDTDRGVFTARSIVLAAPAFATAAIVKEFDRELARLCAAVPYASIATIALAFKRDAIGHRLNGSGYVVPRAEHAGILAATWLSSKWPQRAPEGTALLRTFVGGARDAAALQNSDSDLVRRSLEAIRSVLSIAGEPLFTRVYRFDRANAQHEVGHLARMAEIDRLVARHPGLFVTGSGYRGVGIPDCVADGRTTARHVSDWLGQRAD